MAKYDNHVTEKLFLPSYFSERKLPFLLSQKTHFEVFGVSHLSLQMQRIIQNKSCKYVLQVIFTYDIQIIPAAINICFIALTGTKPIVVAYT